ncbi:helix-turn-helix domain-containing protein [Paraphotobacterium marinum]|uniref:helix-turn-helix domain-containing protein n=1 Tax=Paraphotobacterium marinum TaxID=1755811 RepID=UPI001CEF71AA|nr:helix-turn-helix domain-containing protein [Paraphotobacterium marinum]
MKKLINNCQNKLTQYFNDAPKANHIIASVCDNFVLSKSTLMRRLKYENTQFRDVLAELRMGYVLSLLQTKPYSHIELAHLCGYKSEARFAQRFQHQFGLSLKQYKKKLNLSKINTVHLPYLFY